MKTFVSVCLCTCFFQSQSLVAATIALSGFNQDLIAEKNATNPQSGTSTAFSGWVFNERGAPSQPPTRGFPEGGLVTTVNGSGAVGGVFQLAPFSGGANVLRNNVLHVGLADTPASRQLSFANLSDQRRYSNLQFLTVNQGGSGISWSAILVFSDLSTSTYVMAASRPDWTALPGASTFRFNNNGLVSRGDTDWSTGNFVNGIYLYDDTLFLTPADQLKTLVGVQFDVTANSGGAGLVVFAISTPEPGRIFLLGISGLPLLLRRRKNFQLR